MTVQYGRLPKILQDGKSIIVPKPTSLKQKSANSKKVDDNDPPKDEMLVDESTPE